MSRKRRSEHRSEARARTAVGYARRSTDKQEQSIPDQQRAIQAYCEGHGLTLSRWFIDDAISGTRTTNRPGFQSMIEAAGSRTCEFSLVVVYDVKRFGRLDNDEAGFYRHTLRRHGVEVLYVAEGFAGLGESSDTDDLLRPVKQWQARQESKDLSKVTIRGQLSKMHSGKGCWMGGVPPHGYDLRYTNERGEFLFLLRHMPDGTKELFDERAKLQRTLGRGERVNVSKRDQAHLVLGDPARVATVRRIFDLYTSERRGLAAIADALNREKVPTPRGPAWANIYSGLWRDSTVRSILVNPIYTGDMVWNRRTDARFHRIEGSSNGGAGRAIERRDPHGARLVPNDKSDWIVVRDTHEAIVSRRTWELAQSIREGKPTSAEQLGVPKRPERGQGGWSGKRARFILSGLIRCSRCGGRYQGLTRTKGKRRNDGTQIKSRSYACGSYIARGRSGCEKLGSIPQGGLEDAVIEAVLAYYREQYQGDGGSERLAAAVREHLGHEAHDVAEARQRLEADRKRVEGSIAALLDNISDATRDLVEERLAALRAEREELKRRADDLERLSLNETEVRDMTDEIGFFIAGLEITLRQGVNEARKAALRRCVLDIEIMNDASGAELRVRSLPLETVKPAITIAIEDHTLKA